MSHIEFNRRIDFVVIRFIVFFFHYLTLFDFIADHARHRARTKYIYNWDDFMIKQNIHAWLKSALQFIFNPPLLICFGIAWLITNGWSYIMFSLGIYFDIPILVGIASAYMAFLWFPFTPEKIITVIISIALLKHFFPNDEKTLKKLEDLYYRYKLKHKTNNDAVPPHADAPASNSTGEASPPTHRNSDKP